MFDIDTIPQLMAQQLYDETVEWLESEGPHEAMLAHEWECRDNCDFSKVVPTTDEDYDIIKSSPPFDPVFHQKVIDMDKQMRFWISPSTTNPQRKG